MQWHDWRRFKPGWENVADGGPLVNIPKNIWEMRVNPDADVYIKPVTTGKHFEKRKNSNLLKTNRRPNTEI